MNLTIWHKSQFDECLETITDTKGKSVTVIQKIHNGFFHLFVTESSCKELSTSLRLITCGKSAREHDHLCLIDRLCKYLDRITDVLG